MLYSVAVITNDVFWTMAFRSSLELSTNLFLGVDVLMDCLRTGEAEEYIKLYRLKLHGIDTSTDLKRWMTEWRSLCASYTYGQNT